LIFGSIDGSRTELIRKKGEGKAQTCVIDPNDNVGSQARVTLVVLNPTNKAREKEPNMLIIDSLLKIKVFSLWRGAGEPLSFWVS